MPAELRQFESFADRPEAGRRLAGLLTADGWHGGVVLGLARGGVPVAAAVAGELGATLDVLVARKIGAPDQPEFGLGAVTADGPPVFDAASLSALGLSAADLSEASAAEQAEARRRARHYLAGRSQPGIAGRDVLVVDDGLATGVTARAALHAVRETGPRRLGFAAPVCAPRAAATLRNEADAVYCAGEPEAFMAVGQWYRSFEQTSDEEVLQLLDAAR